MSRTTLESLLEMLDNKNTQEMHPITSKQESTIESDTVTDKLDKVDEKMLSVCASLEILHENVNHLSTRTHETTASIEQLHEKMQQLSMRTNKIAASIEQWQQRIYGLSSRPHESAQEAEPEQPPQLEQDLEIDPEQPPQPEQDPEIDPEQPPQPEQDLEIDPEQPPQLEEEQEAELEQPPQPEQEPKPVPVPRTRASTRGRNHLSLCMMQSDEMKDVMLVISPRRVSEPASPFEPAPSPANLLEYETAESYIIRIREEAELQETIN